MPTETFPPSTRSPRASCRVAGIEGPKADLHIAVEYEIAGGRQHRSIAGSAAYVEAGDLSGGEVDFGEAGQSIRIGSGALHYVQPPAARAGGGQVAAVIDVGNVQRIRLRRVSGGRVAARIPETDSVLLTGLARGR